MSSGRRGPIFTPDQIDVMHAAFVIACGKLRVKPGDRAADDTAVRIVDLARTGVCDVEGLTAAVLVSDRSTMAKLTGEQYSALRLLARRPNGCTDAILLGHGFDLAMLAKLAFDGFANLGAREAMAGSRGMEVFRLQITPAGRKAMAE
jgi:hypothetical protein